ncbi:MAG: hypothetical protein IJK30_06685 [Ruminococcus sp.]|jgi:hypothetical protein|nr:hypothetical protein [Ruminococcus sp.]
MSFGKCSVCDSDVLYNVESREMKCAVCGKVLKTNIWCASDHFVCSECCAKDVMDSLKREAFGVTLKNPVDVAEFLMAKCGFSGHTPHVTAVVSLLVALRNVTGKITDDDIREGFRRGYEIPAGWCGYYGSCGAGVAVGTAFSIALGATPQSDKERSIANFATSVVLKSIAKLGGPCCCVASVRAAMKEAVSLSEKYLGITFPPSERSGKCWASARQAGCRKERCRFFESVNN